MGQNLSCHGSRAPIFHHWLSSGDGGVTWCTVANMPNGKACCAFSPFPLPPFLFPLLFYYYYYYYCFYYYYFLVVHFPPLSAPSLLLPPPLLPPPPREFSVLHIARHGCGKGAAQVGSWLALPPTPVPPARHPGVESGAFVGAWLGVSTL